MKSSIAHRSPKATTAATVNLVPTKPMTHAFHPAPESNCHGGIAVRNNQPSTVPCGSYIGSFSAVILAALCTVTPFFASAQIEGQSVRLDLFGGVSGYNPSVNPPGESKAIDVRLSSYNPGTSASASVIADGMVSMFGSVLPGISRAMVSGGAAGGDAWSSVSQAGVRAYGTDTFTLTAPGQSTGQSATLHFSYYVPGSFSISANGNAYATAAMSFWVIRGHHSDNALIPATDGEFTHGLSEQLNGTTLTVDYNNLPGSRIINYDLNVQVGVPFMLSQNLYVNGYASGGNPGSGSYGVDFSHSAYWNGISSVTVGGVPLSSFSFRNADGISFNDSFAQVPESIHTGAVTALGLLSLGLWRRIRHSSPRA